MSDSRAARAAINLIFSALFLGVAFSGYRYSLGDCCEMTFLSNVATGTVLFCTGIFMLAGFDAPHFLYLDCAVLMTTVFGVCAFFAPEVCFKGVSLLPHVVTPAAMLVFYFLFCDGRGCNPYYSFTALLFPFVYYAFMIAYGRITGGNIYTYFDTNVMSALNLVFVGALAYVLLLVGALILLYANKACRLVFGRLGRLAHNSRYLS